MDACFKKKELFELWNEVKESLLSNKVTKAVMYKYYYPESHSPAPVCVSPSVVESGERICYLLGEILPKIVNDYFLDDPFICSVLQIDDRMQGLLKNIHNVNPILNIGSCRPDFLMSSSSLYPSPLYICEINARFALNGYVYGRMLYEATQVIESRLEDKGYHLLPVRSIFDSILHKFDIKKDIVIIKGREKGYGTNIFASYMKIFYPENNFRFVKPEDVSIHPETKNLQDNYGEITQVILELHQDEILNLSDEIILTIGLRCNCMNDLRTIFLLHDKRLLALLYNKTFLTKYISENDASLLSNCIAPTFILGLNENIKKDAELNPSKYILKPNSLGKGEGTFVGLETSKDEWLNLLNNPCNSQYIIQEFISSEIDTHETIDFSTSEISESNLSLRKQNAVGIILCYNGLYYGLGFIRVSDSKICALSRGGNSFLPYTNINESKNNYKIREEEYFEKYTNYSWNNCVISSLHSDNYSVPWSFSNFNCYLKLLASNIEQEHIISSSDMVLSLFPTSVYSTTETIASIFELSNVSFMPLGPSDSLATIKQTIERFSITVLCGDKHFLLELAQKLKSNNETLTIQKIICGFSPLDEIEYSILQETFQTSNIHNMLGCSVLGIWAIQSNELCGTSKYKTFNNMFKVDASNQSIIVSTSNPDLFQVTKCLLSKIPKVKFIETYQTNQIFSI